MSTAAGAHPSLQVISQQMTQSQTRWKAAITYCYRGNVHNTCSHKNESIIRNSVHLSFCRNKVNDGVAITTDSKALQARGPTIGEVHVYLC